MAESSLIPQIPSLCSLLVCFPLCSLLVRAPSVCSLLVCFPLCSLLVCPLGVLTLGVLSSVLTLGVPLGVLTLGAYSLWTCLVPTLTYALLGSSRHCSQGTDATMALLTHGITSQYDDVDKNAIAQILALQVGVVLFLFGVTHTPINTTTSGSSHLNFKCSVGEIWRGRERERERVHQAEANDQHLIHLELHQFASAKWLEYLIGWITSG